MKIVLTVNPIRNIFSECAVCFLPEDIRPLKGVVGEVDWALNGLITSLIMRGKVSGRLLESVLIRPGRYLASEKLLVFGIGPYKQCRGERVMELGEKLIHVLEGLHVQDISLSYPIPGPEQPLEEFAEFLTKGFLGEEEDKTIQAYLEGVNLAVSCDLEQIDEALLGIQKAKVDLKKHFSVMVIE